MANYLSPLPSVIKQEPPSFGSGPNLSLVKPSDPFASFMIPPQAPPVGVPPNQSQKEFVPPTATPAQAPASIKTRMTGSSSAMPQKKTTISSTNQSNRGTTESVRDTVWDDPNRIAEAMRMAEQNIPGFRERKGSIDELAKLKLETLKPQQKEWYETMDLAPIMALMDSYRGTNVAPYMKPVSPRDSKQDMAKMLLEYKTKGNEELNKYYDDLYKAATGKSGSTSQGVNVNIGQSGTQSTADGLLSQQKKNDYTDRLENTAKVFQGENKKGLEGLSTVNRLASLIEANIPGSKYPIQVSMVRLAGDDKVNVADVAAMSGDPSVAGRFEAIMNELQSGTLTPAQQEHYRAQMMVILNEIVTGINGKLLSRAKSFQRLRGNEEIPESEVVEYMQEYTGMKTMIDNLKNLSRKLSKPRTDGSKPAINYGKISKDAAAIGAADAPTSTSQAPAVTAQDFMKAFKEAGAK